MKPRLSLAVLFWSMGGTYRDSVPTAEAMGYTLAPSGPPTLARIHPGVLGRTPPFTGPSFRSSPILPTTTSTEFMPMRRETLSAASRRRSSAERLSSSRRYWLIVSSKRWTPSLRILKKLDSSKTCLGSCLAFLGLKQVICRWKRWWEKSTLLSRQSGGRRAESGGVRYRNLCHPPIEDGPVNVVRRFGNLVSSCVRVGVACFASAPRQTVAHHSPIRGRYAPCFGAASRAPYNFDGLAAQ